jgi:hypothetical protein
LKLAAISHSMDHRISAQENANATSIGTSAFRFILLMAVA